MELYFVGDKGFEKVCVGFLQMVEELKCLCIYCEGGKLEEFCDFLVNECSLLCCQIVIDINKVIDEVDVENVKVYDVIIDFVVKVLVVVVVLIVIVVFIFVFVVFVIIWGFLKQFGGEFVYVVDIVQQIVAGDFISEVNVKDGDIISLLFVIKKMCDSLVGIVGRVREGIYVIEQVFIEIVIGNLDLFLCMEQQVGVLEEIVLVMEELMFIVK